MRDVVVVRPNEIDSWISVDQEILCRFPWLLLHDIVDL